MGLSIRNAEVERLARELATRRNISLTEAVRQSLEREVRRDDIVREAKSEAGETSQRFKDLMEIAEQAAKIPRISDLSEDEILGYDEFGVPELPRPMR
jgi:antitoxin VapB